MLDTKFALFVVRLAKFGWYKETAQTHYMDIENKLKQIKSRFEEINAAMSDPAIFDDPDTYALTKREVISRNLSMITIHGWI